MEEKLYNLEAERVYMEIDYNHKDDTIEIREIFEEGGFIIRSTHENKFQLFEVPLFGGEERFSGEFKNVMDAIKEGKSWT